MNIKKVLYFIIGKEYKEESPPYPSHFAMINYSPIALKENIRNEQNKLIYEYFVNELGKLVVIVVKKYRYSKARIISLREVKKIPIYDKTKIKQEFPIFAKILPGEVSYNV